MLSILHNAWSAKPCTYASVILMGLVLCFFDFGAFSATPTANDDSVEIKVGESVPLFVLDNDQNVASDPADRELTVVEAPQYGEVSVHDDTYIDYTPDPDFYGDDSFVYRIANEGEGSSQAEVTIKVTPTNYPPIPVKDLIVTREGTPVTVKLSATDQDIDPMRPYLHPVEFKILSGPSHGELIGDVRRVVFYKSPHEVFVEAEYVPDPEFRGIDSITYEVEDKYGETNISFIKIDVVPETAPLTSLSGYWGTSVSFQDHHKDFFSDFGTNLTTIYRYGDFEARTIARWSMTTWDSLKIRTRLPLGGLDLKSTLDFNPDQADTFDYWRAQADFYYSEVDYKYVFNLDSNPENIYHELRARWRVGDVSFAGKTRFSGPAANFEEATVRSGFNWSEPNLSVNTSLGFDDNGFDEFTVDVGDVPLLFGISFGVKTTFTPTSKQVSPSLSYRSAEFDCFRVKGKLVTNDEGNMVEGLSIREMVLQNTFENDINFKLRASLSDHTNKGHTLSLSGPFFAGYRAPGRWRLTTDLASEADDQLFGWERSRLKVIAPLSSSLDIETQVTWRSQSPRWAIEFGGEIFW